MGLPKFKSTSVLNSSKVTLNSSPALALKDDKVPPTNGLINQAFHENFSRKNRTYFELPSVIQLRTGQSFSFDGHRFCWKYHSPTYQYSVDYLHEVREKMYEKALNGCTCFDARPAWEYCAFETEEWPEIHFEHGHPRTYAVIRSRELNGGQQRNESSKKTVSKKRAPTTEPAHCSNGIAPSSEGKPSSQDRSDEQLNISQKPSYSGKAHIVTRPKERISPPAPQSFQTLRRTWSDECWDKLSLSIWQKFDATKQTEETFAKKMKLWRKLYRCIQKIPRVPKLELFLMGSTISGFGMEGSDIDMCVVAKDGPMYCDQRTEALENLLHVKHFLETLPTDLDHISLICAKVPILRFKQKMDDIDIEVSLNNYVGIRNTQLLHCYAQLDWRVRPLVVIVKMWAKHHNLNDPRNATISSYSLALMVINFLQCGVTPAVLPCLHKLYPDKFSRSVQPDNLNNFFERVDPFPTENDDSLGNLLINFLKYYTNFDYANYAVSVRTGSVIPVKKCSWKCSSTTEDSSHSFLNIEEPFNLTNTGKSVHNGYIFSQIISVFAASWKALEDGQDLSDIFGKTTFPTPSRASVNTSYY